MDFTLVIAHQSFPNPLACRNVFQLSVKEGKLYAPLYDFVQGTALKMYHWELDGKIP